MSYTPGSPEGFKSDFFNILWNNGNIVFADFSLQDDTVKLNIAHDNKNNLASHLLAVEIPDFLQGYSANNITKITTANNSVLGPSGTVAVERSLTYNDNNNVETVTSFPGAFQEPARTVKYFYNCISTGMAHTSADNLRLAPNPADNYFVVNLPVSSGTLTITDLTGREVIKQRIDEHSGTVDIGGFASSVYFVEFLSGNQVFRGKVLKR